MATARRVAPVSPRERLIEAMAREALAAWSYYEKFPDAAALAEMERSMKLLGQLLRLWNAE